MTAKLGGARQTESLLTARGREIKFDRLDEPTGCNLISWPLQGRGSQEGIR